MIDNTFQTSYLQRPLELGVDIVMYSLAKYMNGHSDVIMGAAITNREDLHQRLRFIQYGKCDFKPNTQEKVFPCGIGMVEFTIFLPSYSEIVA